MPSRKTQKTALAGASHFHAGIAPARPTGLPQGASGVAV